MSRLLPALALMLLLPLLPLRGGRGDEEDPIALPANPKEIVISLDYQGGLRPPRKIEAPVLTVLADGTLRAPEIWHGHGTAVITLPKLELRALLDFVVREQRFMDLDKADIREKVSKAAAAAGTPAPLDGVNTVVTVHLADRARSVSWYALEQTAERYPQVEELARLARVAKRLARLRILTIAGGEKALAGYLDLANAALAKAREDEPPLTPADLKGAFITEGGGRRLVFRRREPDRDPVFAQITVPKEGEPTVVVE